MIKLILIVGIVGTCIYVSGILFFQQVIQKINPNANEKRANIICVIIGFLFGLASFFLGGEINPLNEYN